MVNKKSIYKIISVGGSIIIPSTGFNIDFLKQFRALILREVASGIKFILVIGGGSTCRHYQQTAQAVVAMTSEDLDWLGIKSTIFNAEFVRLLFKDHAFPAVVTNPTRKVKTARPIIVAAGWKPGCSTDNDAVLLAKAYGAKEMINLSNIDYVYDSDPRTNPAARKFEHMTWKELRAIVGNRWTPGANVPFDPQAARHAEKLKLTVKFAKGTDLNVWRVVLEGGEMKGGTIIS